jgi:hypothetical protein
VQVAVSVTDWAVLGVIVTLLVLKLVDCIYGNLQARRRDRALLKEMHRYLREHPRDDT